MKPEFTEKVTGFLAFGDKQLLAITDSILNIVNSNFEMESSNGEKKCQRNLMTNTENLLLEKKLNDYKKNLKEWMFL
ncbi:hypothetical protein NW066_05430 [Mycoplasmopsis felis]|uniref:hypothetical protein n=1 Tax=Mycoplasmopsis felis TaxID=33923 RepID=UPI0021AE43B3|nr:hypothetical protein [Mycoplasmopsis felis]UWV84962.1 hypothetical protein NW066_05430 [Mycoplasmopsis felis]